MYNYLREYKEKYNYDIVFFVSDQTYNYYYDGGLNKVISPDDNFDSWYFNFLDLNQEYDIQIDHDEVNDFSVSSVSAILSSISDSSASAVDSAVEMLFANSK